MKKLTRFVIFFLVLLLGTPPTLQAYQNRRSFGLATNAETVTGTETKKAVTPAGLTAKLADYIAAPGAIGTTTAPTIRGRNDEDAEPATDNLNINQCCRGLINNFGQTTDATVTLPACAEGYEFTVILGTTVAKYYRLDPNGSDSIYLDGVTAGDGKYVGVASAALGNAIHFKAFQTGATAWDWYAGAISGLWVSE